MGKQALAPHPLETGEVPFPPGKVPDTFQKRTNVFKNPAFAFVTFLAVCMDLCSGMQCSEPLYGEYVCLYSFGPIHISEPLKCSLAGRSGQVGKLSFRWFFVCLQVILATDRDTQLVVCALFHDQAEAGL